MQNFSELWEIFFDIYENYWNNATFFQQLWLLGLIQLLE